MLLQLFDDFSSSLAVQHERGPRNSTLRRQVAMYLKETSDLRVMAAMGAPQHFFRTPMFSQGVFHQDYRMGTTWSVWRVTWSITMRSTTWHDI